MAAGVATDDVRRALGPVGALLGVSGPGQRVADQLAAIGRLEDAGYRAVWTNEIIGADALVRASLWLAATERLVVGTCVANVWARAAQTTDAAATQLAEAHPGRFVLGLGVGNADQAASVGADFGTPLATARRYLGQLAAPAYPRILAANGPKMLALAGELADGALPAGGSADFVTRARHTLGPDKLLVVYAPVQTSDTAAAVHDQVTARLEAGADHVIVGSPYGTELSAAVARHEELAGTVLVDGRT